LLSNIFIEGSQEIFNLSIANNRENRGLNRFIDKRADEVEEQENFIRTVAAGFSLCSCMKSNWNLKRLRQKWRASASLMN